MKNDLNDKDYRIKCHLHIGEKEKDVLRYFNTLQTKRKKKVIKYTNLVSAFFLFSIAFYSYTIHISWAWIFLLLSVGATVLGLSAEKFQRAFMTAIIDKEVQQTNNEREYLFSKEGVDITTELGTAHNHWSSFVSRGEIENYIYLMRKDRNIILVNKDDLSENDLIRFQSLIQDIEMDQIKKENKMSVGIKTLVAATITVVIVSIAYIGIKIGYPLSQGEIFRLWFVRTVPVILLLALQCLDIIWTCVLFRVIRVNGKKSVVKSILIWAAGIIVVLAMALGILVHMLNDDSEHYNGDGTVIIKSPVWLDKPSFALYKEENFLVLKYLRDADGIEDIDTSITQEEYINEKYESMKNEPEHHTEEKEEPLKNDDPVINEGKERDKRIEEGYLRVYETYIKENDAEYRKDYNAKGYEYIITFEDETQIRYLMYDHDNDEGTKAQYVYFKNIKNPDGSWSPSDSEILDMYQYDYQSNEVEDLNKTSW